MIAAMAGTNSRPRSVSAYSTDGGEVGITRRVMMPRFFRSRSRALSTLAEIGGMSDRSSPKRRAPALRYQITFGVQAPPRSARHSVNGHPGNGARFLRSFKAMTIPITKWKPENAGYHRLRHIQRLSPMPHWDSVPSMERHMSRRNEAVSRLGIEHPIIQGPFGGGLSTQRLVAAVSNLGGLGSYGCYHLAPEAIGPLAAEIRALTAKPFALNLWVSDHDAGGHRIDQAEFDRIFEIFSPYFRELGVEKPAMPQRYYHRFEDQVEALIESAPPAFSFVFGIPAPDILARCRKRGIVTIGAATSIAEAEALEDAGIDLIVATGFDAGGHRPSFLARAEDSLMGTFALTQLVSQRVKTPVIAAGGIADGRGIRAAFALG